MTEPSPQRAAETALILVDLQYFDVDPEVGLLATRSPTEQASYLDQIWSETLPAAVSALHHARRQGLEVIHVRIQSLTRDGRDRSPAHKRLGLHVAPGSKGADFLPGLEPAEEEVVLNKTPSDAFHSTLLHHLLRNIGVRQLFLVGVLTNECVASTARSASELGFETMIIAEGCAALNQEEHQSALSTLDGRYARVLSLSEFKALDFDG